MTVDDIALTLHRSIGVKTAAHLMACFGSAEALFNAPMSELIGRAELKEEIAQEIVKKRHHSDAQKEMATLRKMEVVPIAATDDAYPHLLREINDYPHVIYTKGDIVKLSDPKAKLLSVVGTRTATEYGRKVCDRLIGDLVDAVPGLIVVSGLAAGIDAFAHRASVLSGCPTFGVMGAALREENIVSDNRLLAREMVKCGGGIITEYHTKSPSGRFGFTARNRIVAGLTHATLVVEAPVKSGSLQTAHIASSYGREVLAIPGRIDSSNSFGVNNIIRTQVARLVQTADDIIRELGWDNESAVQKVVPVPDMLSDEAKRLLGLLTEGEAVSVEVLMEQSGLSVSELFALSFELEMEGLIRNLPGNMWEKR